MRSTMRACESEHGATIAERLELQPLRGTEDSPLALSFDWVRSLTLSRQRFVDDGETSPTERSGLDPTVTTETHRE